MSLALSIQLPPMNNCHPTTYTLSAYLHNWQPSQNNVSQSVTACSKPSFVRRTNISTSVFYPSSTLSHHRVSHGSCYLYNYSLRRLNTRRYYGNDSCHDDSTSEVCITVEWFAKVTEPREANIITWTTRLAINHRTLTTIITSQCTVLLALVAESCKRPSRAFLYNSLEAALPRLGLTRHNLARYKYDTQQ